jgi:beta-lactam-binding protein with PASTA domain
VIVAVVVLAAARAAAVILLWPQEERVTVPDVVGLSTESAERVLEAAGLTLGDVDHEAVSGETPEPATVLAQVSSAGTKAEAGSAVSLVVAEVSAEPDGEDEQETPPAGSEGGSGAGGSSGSGGGAGTDATKAWHTIDAASGTQDNTDHEGRLFTLSEATPLELTVTVSSSPAGGEVRFTLLD